MCVLVRTASSRRFLRVLNLCFERNYEKSQSTLSEISVFGGEIFYIFEKACFRNEFESARVNEPSVFESLHFYCTCKEINMAFGITVSTGNCWHILHGTT